MLKGAASYKDILLGRPTKYEINWDRASIKPPGRSRSFTRKHMAISKVMRIRNLHGKDMRRNYPITQQ